MPNSLMIAGIAGVKKAAPIDPKEIKTIKVKREGLLTFNF
jgi:hypothetical protein